MTKLTESELKKLGDLTFSTHTFVRKVAEVKKDLENKFHEIYGDTADWNAKSIRRHRFSFELLEQERPRGFGYLASSLEADEHKEIFWTAHTARECEQRNFHPIIIPVDEFYQFIPANHSLVLKTRLNKEVYDSEGKPYIFILSGFSQSQVFEDPILAKVPNQHNAKLNVLESDLTIYHMIFGKRASTEYEYGIDGKIEMLMETYQSIPKSLAAMVSQGLEIEQAKFAMAIAFLLRDKQNWQDLWYEGTKGTPLYIIAPSTFHDAKNRLNICWGHGAVDYQYRANCSLQGQCIPVIDIVQGKVAYDFNRIRYEFQGMNIEEFTSTINNIHKVLCKD